MRKDAGLEISDRIDLRYEAAGEVAAALRGFADFIGQETLAATLAAGPLTDPLAEAAVSVGDETVQLRLRKSE